MAMYKGKITLVDMRESGSLYTWVMYADDKIGTGISPSPENKSYIGILYNQTKPDPSKNPEDYNWTPLEGKNLVSTKMYYAVSANGVVPPIEIIDFKIDDQGILTFKEDGATSLIINDNYLGAKIEDIEHQLSLNNNYIMGIGAKWSEIIPEVPQGYFLWTKIEYIYSDGERDIHYSNSYHGADGKEGPRGLDSSSYKIRANQTEILKFVNLDGAVSFSPENLEFAVYKDQSKPGSDVYYEQVRKLSKERFSLSVYNINTDQYIDIPSEFIKFDSKQDVFNVDLYSLSGEVEAFNILLEEECLMKYSYSLSNEEGNFNLVDYINIRYGIKKDMAALSIEAGKIVQSIQNSYLTFSATGLTIQNGGFQILDEFGNPLLQSTKGNLVVTGTINANDGYFAGELRSRSGYFEGSITAKDGRIGGFIISEDELISQKTYISKVENGQEVYFPNIVLNGTTGQILAHDIVLGTGAVIEDYIQLGQAFIYNPDNNKDKFIEAGNISLNQTGILKLGSIELFGGATDAQAYLKAENGNWIIQEDGMAIFNDIYANNVHLQDTILEIGSVQAMGSLMMFKDSWSISRIDNNTIIIDSLTNLSENDWIYSGKNIYKIIGIQQDNSSTILTLNKTYSSSDGLIITKFGKAATENDSGFILSILGEQAMINDNRGFASGNALVISDFVEENGVLSYRKRLVLGQLDGAIDKNITGLGLYADNVFLNGSLTTKVDEDSYAGINTIGEAIATVFGDKDQSRIIFWAGSASSSNLDIQEAPFQVTEKGSIYASKGIFRDSIISDSIIQGADIYAARIHGGTTDQASSLTIYDTSLGIIFKEGYQTSEKEVFSIRADGLQQYGNYFIEIKNNNVGFYGDKFVINTRENNYLEITSNPNTGTDLITKSVVDGLVKEKNYQTFSDDKIAFGFNNGSQREDGFVINKDKSELKSLSVWLEKDIYFGSGTSYMQYKKASEGYDLFINE